MYAIRSYYGAEAFGVRLERPRHWHKRVDEMGLLTFGNGVDAFTKLGCARLEGPSRIDEVAELGLLSDLAMERKRQRDAAKK